MVQEIEGLKAELLGTRRAVDAAHQLAAQTLESSQMQV